jgi:ATP-binding cassette subfamily C protein LapB
MSLQALRDALRAQRDEGGGSAAPAPRPGSTPRVDGPRRAHPLADLRRVARVWSGDERLGAGDARFDAESLPPRETLIAKAADLGLAVTVVTRALAKLDAADAPCVLVLSDGTSVVFLGREGRDGVLVESGGTPHVMARAEVEALHTGTVFLLAPTSARAREDAPAPSREAAAAPVSEAAATTSLSLVRTVATLGLRETPGLFRQLMVAALLSNLLMLALPLFTMAVYDRVIPHLAMETLWALAIGVTIAIGLDFAIRYVRLKLVDAVALSTSLTLQAKLYRRIVDVRLAVAPRTSGGLATHLRELDAICQTVPPLLVAVLVDLPFFLVLLVLLYSIAGPVVLAPVIGVAALVAISVVGHLATRKAHVETAKLTRAQANQVIETIGALELVKTTNGGPKLLKQWERLGDASAYEAHHGRLWASLGQQATILISQAVIVLVVLIGVYQIGAGAMTVGALAASTLLVGRAIGPIGTLVALVDRLLHLTHTAEALQGLLNAPSESGGDAARGGARPIEGRFDLTNVSFTYPGEASPALKDVTLTITPGEKVALIGRVGSGKSTLTRLFLRLHEPASGVLAIDGRDARQIPPRHLRDRVGFMRQDSMLFDDTLHANLVFGLDQVAEAAFERAVTASGVKEIAAKHAKGYSLEVGPRGERLSGGERQAVALARALMTDPKVLILDEPTAAMDNTLEARVIKALREIAADRTFIVATHRAPVLALVDRIVWLEGGRVIADGPRDEVLKKMNAPQAA